MGVACFDPESEVVMANVTYRDEGHDGQAYIIVEYHGPMAVYVFKGYLKGDMFVLYPFKSLRKGERRDKATISIREVRRA